MQTNYLGQDPWDFLKIFYLLLLGDFGSYQALDEGQSLNSELFFLIFLVVTVIIMIVLLNLLIAIISESFTKVMSLEAQSENFELYHLNLDFKRNLKNKESYYQKWKSIYLLIFIRKTDENQDLIFSQRNNQTSQDNPDSDSLKEFMLKVEKALGDSDGVSKGLVFKLDEVSSVLKKLSLKFESLEKNNSLVENVLEDNIDGDIDPKRIFNKSSSKSEARK